MKTTKSQELLKRANKVIPGQTQTLSKRYGRLPQGIAPAYLSYGSGCKVYDVDGNEYIDWSASLGSVVLGYSLLPMGLTPSYPLPTPEEVELAEKLVDIIPCAEMVRLFKTGSDACTAAVMLSCKASKHDNWFPMTASTGYHGWLDSLYRHRIHKIEYGDLEGLERVFSEWKIDCFILEPMDRSCPEKFRYEYLYDVRELCNKHNVILIFDEILTGFRYYGLAGIHGNIDHGRGFDNYEDNLIYPDLACYGKAMSNGYPLSALVGKREIMENLKDMKISGTYYSEALSIESALYTIDVMERENVTDYLWKKGEYLNQQIKSLITYYKLDDIVRLKGFGPWNSFVWSDNQWDEEQVFLQEIFKRGIFYNRDHFVMYSHEQEDIRKTLEVYETAFEIIKYHIGKENVKEQLISKVDRSLVK